MFHLENLSLESISEFHFGLQHFFQEIAVYSSKNSCEVLCTAVQLFFNSCAVFEKSTSNINCCGCAVAVRWGARFHSGMNKHIEYLNHIHMC